jgi:hypothetical protein
MKHQEHVDADQKHASAQHPMHHLLCCQMLPLVFVLAQTAVRSAVVSTRRANLSSPSAAGTCSTRTASTRGSRWTQSAPSAKQACCHSRSSPRHQTATAASAGEQQCPPAPSRLLQAVKQKRSQHSPPQQQLPHHRVQCLCHHVQCLCHRVQCLCHHVHGCQYFTRMR